MAAVHMVFTWSQFGLRLTTDPNILTKHNRKHSLTLFLRLLLLWNSI